MSNYDEQIDYYIKVVSVNYIKAHIKAKNVKVFPEYDNEVNAYLILGKKKWIEENIGIWV